MGNKIKNIFYHLTYKHCLYFTTITIYTLIYIETLVTNIFVYKPVTYICVYVLLNVVTCSW